MSFLRNSVFNFAGSLVPAIAALLTVPVIVSRLGEEHYGVFVLVTSIVGYFALLDINATAGSVKYVAEHHARREHDQVRQVLSFGMMLYVAIGVLGGAGIFIWAEPLATKVFNLPDALHHEAVVALRWAAFAFLAGQLQVYLQSVPESLQRFDVAAKIEGAFGTLVPVLTVAVVLLGGSLVEIIIARLALSLINIALLLVVVRHLLPEAGWRKPTRAVVRAISSFSAFSYLSRVATITYANADKLIIAAVVDMRALSFYAVPFMLVTRLFGMAYRFSEVLFPTASALSAQDRNDELRHTYLVATRNIVYLNACIAVMLVAIAPEVLRYWAGDVFAGPSIFVMVLLSFALFSDSLTNLPSLFNDGLGRPKFTGLAAVARAAVGMTAAWFAVRSHGIEGAAVAQLVVSLSAALVFLVLVHRWSIPVPLREVVRFGFMPSVPAVLLGLAIGATATTRPLLGVVQVLLAACGLAALMGLYGWLVVLDASTRARVQRMISSRLGLRVG